MNEIVRIPLLRDHHSHPLFYSAFTSAVNLQEVEDRDTAERLLRENAVHAEIAVAHGWRSNFFQWSQSDFENLPAAAVFNLSLHSVMINKAGCEVLARHYGDITEKIHDRTWYESNLRVVLNWFAKLNISVASLQTFYADLLKNGVWSAEELLLVDEDEIKLFETAELTGRTKFWAAPDTFSELSDDAKQKVAGLKLFTDGAIGSHTAAFNCTYSDDPANNGMLIYNDDQLSNTVTQCLETGKSLAVHAIGDRAITQIVSVLENLALLASTVPVIRIEHAQMIDKRLAIRAKKLDLTLSMQPNFSSDSVDYTDRLPAELRKRNNPFRMLIDEVGFECGKDLIFGSDGMPHGIKTAFSQSLLPNQESQKLTLEEFKSGYCLDDESKGWIEINTSKNDWKFKVVPAINS